MIRYRGQYGKTRRTEVDNHIIPAEYLTELKSIGIRESLGRPFPQWSVKQSLDVMDLNGIRAAITSIASPGVYFGDPVLAKRCARLCNEFSAMLISDHPSRFDAYASLLLPDAGKAAPRGALLFEMALFRHGAVGEYVCVPVIAGAGGAGTDPFWNGLSLRLRHNFSNLPHQLNGGVDLHLAHRNAFDVAAHGDPLRPGEVQQLPELLFQQFDRGVQYVL